MHTVGSQYVGTVAPDQPTMLGELNSRLSSVAARLTLLTRGNDAFFSRLRGPQPDQCENAKDPIGGTIVTQIERELDKIASLISTLESQQQDFNRII
jgi:hypothetical protein